MHVIYWLCMYHSQEEYRSNGQKGGIGVQTFCRLIRVHIGIRQYFAEGVQNVVHWHFFKSNMAAATPKYH